MATLHSKLSQLETSAGVPSSGALWYFYQVNSTTPITIYQDAAQGSTHTNPVEADASGIFPPIYVASATYKTVLKTAAGVTIQTVDDIALGTSTFSDATFTLQDNADPSKQLVFQLSGITTATTRTITVPDASGTLILSSSTATDTTPGIVEKATDAEVQTGTDTSRYITPAGLTAKEATAANIRANTADRIYTTDVAVSAMAEVTLTDTATIAVDGSTGINFVVTLGGNRALGNMTNTVTGRTGHIRVIQDGTGTRTLSYESSYEFAGGSAPTLSTPLNSEDILYYEILSSTRIVMSIIKAIA